MSIENLKLEQLKQEKFKQEQLQLEQLKLDKIITTRNQFGQLRYKVVSESLLFGQQDLIIKADRIIQENEQALRKLSSQYQSNIMAENYIIAAATRLMAAAESFEYIFVAEKSMVFNFKEDKAVIQISLLENMIREYLSEQSSSRDRERKILEEQETIIAIEITPDVDNSLKGLTQKGKQDFLINHIKDRINLEQQQFFSVSEYLVSKYSSKILKYKDTIKNQSSDQVSIYVIGKQFNRDDYKFYFDNFFDTDNGELRICNQGQISNQNIKNPFFEYNKLYSNNKMLNCIAQMTMLTNQCPYSDISNLLETYFGNLSHFATLQQLLAVLEHSKQIILWDSLIANYFKQIKEQELLTQSKIRIKQSQNFKSIKSLLNSSYESLSSRFKDKFYDFSNDNEITEYASLNISNTPKIGNNQDVGACAYQIFPEGILLYSKLTFINKVYSCCSLLHYQQKNKLKERGPLAQLILADFDDRMQILKVNFTLKEQNQFIVSDQLLSNNEVKSVIKETLIRIVQVRMKRLLLNPEARNKVGQQIYLEI